MERIKYYIEKYKLIVFLIICILCLTIFIVYYNKKDNNITNIQALEVKEEIKEEKENVISKVKVDIKGFIKKPGVYELDENSRVIDVINKAGGLKEGANTEYINLSKKIQDEMVIIIYSNSEVEKYKKTDKEIIYIEYECICPDNKNDACINESDIVNTNGTKKQDNDIGSIKDDKVSINTSKIEELMTLKGIGESKAQAILDYRKKNGDFKTLEDIMNVPGIGEAAYSKIKDSIKL